MQILAVHNPVVGGVVDVVPLAFEHWLVAAAVASVLLFVEEARKLVTTALIRRASASDQLVPLYSSRAR